MLNGFDAKQHQVGVHCTIGEFRSESNDGQRHRVWKSRVKQALVDLLPRPNDPLIL